MKEKTKSILKSLPVIIFGIIIFIISSLKFTLPTGLVPGISKPSNLLMILHIGEFGVFSMLFMYGFYPKIKLQFIILISILYSVIDEIHQGIVPTRYFDILDIFYDCVGIILGIIGYFIILLIWYLVISSEIK
jgi:hypothetical protein